MSSLIHILTETDRRADKVVPRSGHSARLTVFVAGAMAFLAVFAVALAMASGRLADRWGSELGRAATLRIPAGEQRAEQTAAALRLLEQTPGVTSARALSAAEQAGLLAPWFGPDLPLDSLPVPQLIEIVQDDPGYDAAGLRLRLGAELPGAVLDDHSRWRAPLVEAAQALRRLALTSILLIAAATGAMITLAARAALAANGQIIEVLRLVGARDRFIADAFVRRFTFRTLYGATVGTVLGLIGVLLMPDTSDVGGVLSGLGFSGAGWLLPLLIPVLGAMVAFAATSVAADRKLKELY